MSYTVYIYIHTHPKFCLKRLRHLAHLALDPALNSIVPGGEFRPLDHLWKAFGSMVYQPRKVASRGGHLHGLGGRRKQGEPQRFQLGWDAGVKPPNVVTMCFNGVRLR